MPTRAFRSKKPARRRAVRSNKLTYRRASPDLVAPWDSAHSSTRPLADAPEPDWSFDEELVTPPAGWLSPESRLPLSHRGALDTPKHRIIRKYQIGETDELRTYTDDFGNEMPIIEDYENLLSKIERTVLWPIAVFMMLVALVSPAFTLIAQFQEIQVWGISTGSMEPEMKVNTTILSRKVERFDELQVGDDIVFATVGTSIPTVHRIVEIVPGRTGKVGDIRFRTKGINNEEADTGLVIQQNIQGQAYFNIDDWEMPLIGKDRQLPWGRWMTFLQIPQVQLIMVGPAILLFFINWLLRNLKMHPQDYAEAKAMAVLRQRELIKEHLRQETERLELLSRKSRELAMMSMIREMGAQNRWMSKNLGTQDGEIQKKAGKFI